MISHLVVVRGGATLAMRDVTAVVPWWSFTKTVIASAALALVRDNLLALDEPLSGGRFTLRQLLRHQAGLADYGQLPAYQEAVARGDEPWSEPELLARADANRLRYAPGQGWGYSNIGYLYARRLIESATGEGLHAALRDLVFRPLGIDHARVAYSRSDLADVRMCRATNFNPQWVYHGLLVGPLCDAALFLDRLMTGHLLPRHLMEAMCERHPLDDLTLGRPWVSPGYGLGLMVGTVQSGAVLSGHTGVGPGSTIAVYHVVGSQPSVTCAAFTAAEDPGPAEREAVLMAAQATAVANG